MQSCIHVPSHAITLGRASTSKMSDRMMAHGKCSRKTCGQWASGFRGVLLLHPCTAECRVQGTVTSVDAHSGSITNYVCSLSSRYTESRVRNRWHRIKSSRFMLTLQALGSQTLTHMLSHARETGACRVAYGLPRRARDRAESGCRLLHWDMAQEQGLR